MKSLYICLSIAIAVMSLCFFMLLLPPFPGGWVKSFLYFLIRNVKALLYHGCDGTLPPAVLMSTHSSFGVKNSHFPSTNTGDWLKSFHACQCSFIGAVCR